MNIIRTQYLHIMNLENYLFNFFQSGIMDEAMNEILGIPTGERKFGKERDEVIRKYIRNYIQQNGGI